MEPCRNAWNPATLLALHGFKRPLRQRLPDDENTDDSPRTLIHLATQLKVNRIT